METGYNVSDCMTQDPITIEVNKSIKDCAELMKKHNLGSFVVLDNQKPVGIVTQEDFVYKAICQKIDVDKPIKIIMTKEIINISPNVDIFKALEIMNANSIRHLAVISKGKLVGYLTLKDILKIEPTLFDIYVDRIELREEETKPSRHNEDEGICEICGNYSKRIKIYDSVAMCPSCKKDN